jgi:hypothetical protein
VNEHEPFQPSDLQELDEFLDQAWSVVSMEQVADGNHVPCCVGMRHDVDNIIEPAVAMAAWEAERGYRSTYFILHTAPYWADKPKLRDSLSAISEFGHEIGFHLNALTVAIVAGGNPLDIAQDAVDELRSYGYPCRGVVAHGDNACHQHHFVNDELFTESARPDYGAPDRLVGGVKLEPISRSELGFDYDPNWLPRAAYLSDSGGRWSQPFHEVAARFPFAAGQLHMLVHPDWWGEAFAHVRQAA